VHAGDAYRWLTGEFRTAAGDLAAREAESVLLRVLRVSRSELFLDPARPLSDDQYRRCTEVARRRKSGEPLPYILGSTYFHSVDVAVSRDVLIPRPDTETLVQAVLDHEGATRRFFIDLCTGSGAVAAAILHCRPGWNAVAADMSAAAAVIARKNTDSRCSCVVADMVSAFNDAARFDFVVCNPPYIPCGAIDTLDVSVRSYEPRMALDGGPDGLDFYRALTLRAGRLLRRDGWLYAEIGADQRAAVERLFTQAGWTGVTCYNDLAGRPRVVRAAAPHAD